MSARIAHITRITQVTLKTINDALLVDDLWLHFAYFKILANFVANEYWLDRAIVRVVIPFKDQESANYVKKELKNLSIKVQTTVQPVFVSRKIGKLTTLLFNTVVIIAIWRTPVLHQPRNVLLGSLAVSDFLVGLTSEPSFLAAQISLLLGNMEIYCLAVFIHFYTSWMVNGISFLTLSAISFERFLALRLHLRYAELITTTRVFITALIYWVIWITWITLMWFWAKDKVVSQILIAFCCLTATAVAWCYVAIYKTVRRHSKEI